MERPWMVRWLVLFCLVLPVQDAAADSPYPTTRFVVSHAELPTQALRLHQRRSATVSGAEVHRYQLWLRRGQFAAVRVQQLDGNLAAVAFAPDGHALDIVDQNGNGQAEVVTFTATSTGLHSLQLAMYEWDAKPTAYTIELRRLAPARRDATGRVAQLFEAWYEPGEPGAALLVRRDGRAIYRRAIGSDGAGDALTPRTPFDLASVSKQFTGYAVALLLSRGELRLDDDIRRYLPELRDYGNVITVRHLLEHTSGVRDWDGLFGLLGRRLEDGIGVDEILVMAARQSQLNFVPGSQQAYSNTNYVLLALIVERVTRQPFDAWLKAQVLEPLGLQECGLPPGRQVPYGSTALACSADDLARWLTSAQLPAPASPTSDYVFGRWHAVRDGVKVVGHQGLGGRARTSVHSFPERGLDIIYLANDGNDATYPRVRLVEDLFLGIAAPPLEVPTDDYVPPVKTVHPAGWAEAYVGTYACADLDATFTLIATDAGLALQQAGLGTLPLVEQDTDRFASADPAAPALAFDRDASGRVTGFHVLSEDVGSLQFDRMPPTP